MRKMKSLVYGVGDKGFKYPVAVDRIHLKEYRLWIGFLSRGDKLWQSRYPSYAGTTCSENFKSYTFFYEWCQRQVGFCSRDEKGRIFQLDKDLLIRGNNCYSEDTCVFIPQAINKLLTKTNALRGEYPIGVHFCNRDKNFKATCNNGKKIQVRIGSYSTKEEAFIAYKNYKEMVIKQVAEKYKEQIDPRAYTALLNYEVNIND